MFIKAIFLKEYTWIAHLKKAPKTIEKAITKYVFQWVVKTKKRAPQTTKLKKAVPSEGDKKTPFELSAEAVIPDQTMSGMLKAEIFNNFEASIAYSGGKPGAIILIK